MPRAVSRRQQHVASRQSLCGSVTSRAAAAAATGAKPVVKIVDLVHVEPRGISTPYFMQEHKIPVALEGPYSAQFLDVTYTNDPAAADRFIAKHIARRGTTDIGFDVEHRPTRIAGEKANLALLQIAAHGGNVGEEAGEGQTGTCGRHPVLLFALYHNRGKFSPGLRNLLMDARIAKHGVGIKCDLRHLKSLHLSEASQAAYMELGPRARDAGLVEAGSPRREIGLKALTKLVMDEACTTYKTKRLTMTNWERGLNVAQVKYAAMDAFTGIEIFRLLEEQKKKRRKQLAEELDFEAILD